MRMTRIKLIQWSFILIVTSVLVLMRDENVIEAIKCYVCQSNVDPKCADPFDNLTLPITDCDAHPRADLVPKTELDVIEEKGFFSSFGQPAPVIPLRASLCRKIRQKVNGEWRTIRGCGYLSSPNDSPDDSQSGCQMRHGTYDIFVESCACNSKDGCNGAHGTNNLDVSKYAIMMCMALISIGLPMVAI